MKQRMMALALALCMLLSLTPVTVPAAAADDGLTLTLSEDGKTLSVTGNATEGRGFMAAYYLTLTSEQRSGIEYVWISAETTNFWASEAVRATDVSPLYPINHVKRVTVEEGNPAFEDIDGVLFEKNQNQEPVKLSYVPDYWTSESGGTDLVIPATVTDMSMNALNGVNQNSTNNTENPPAGAENPQPVITIYIHENSPLLEDTDVGGALEQLQNAARPVEMPFAYG